MLAAFVLLAAQAASSSSTRLTPEQADARCVAAFGIMASDGAEEKQRAAQLGGLYFSGKLMGRDPKVDLKAVMLKAANAVGKNPKGEIARCGTELKAFGEAMQAAGGATPGATGKDKDASAETKDRRHTTHSTHRTRASRR